MSVERGLLAFDVGNTSVNCAEHRGGRWRHVLRVHTRPVRDLATRLLGAMPEKERPDLARARWLACSVHPAADAAIETLRTEMGTGSLEFFGRELSVPIENTLPEPDQVGRDRLLLALGAREQFGAPCVIVCAGTAVTVDVVDAEGRFVGGAIAPGFALAARALHEGAALLPLAEPAEAGPVPGRSTEEAIRLGIRAFCAGGVARLVEQYGSIEGMAEAPVVCTGTDAPLLTPALPPARTRQEPDLIFHGMAAAVEGE
ncbi:MAG: type III pantothenate kinase [Candidatus Brocadiia bacterium]